MVDFPPLSFSSFFRQGCKSLTLSASCTWGSESWCRWAWCTQDWEDFFIKAGSVVCARAAVHRWRRCHFHFIPATPFSTSTFLSCGRVIPSLIIFSSVFLFSFFFFQITHHDLSQNSLDVEMMAQLSLLEWLPFSKKSAFFFPPPLRSGHTGTQDNMETFTIHDMLINSTDIYRILCEFAIRNISECENSSEPGTPPPSPEPKGKTTAHTYTLRHPVLCFNIISSCVWRNRIAFQPRKRITHPCARSPKITHRPPELRTKLSACTAALKSLKCVFIRWWCNVWLVW